MTDDAEETVVDYAALERKLDRVQGDVKLLMTGLAALLQKLPEERAVYRPYDPAERADSTMRRPPGMDDLTWKITRTLRMTDNACRDIEHMKTKIDAIFRDGIEFTAPLRSRCRVCGHEGL